MTGNLEMVLPSVSSVNASYADREVSEQSEFCAAGSALTGPDMAASRQPVINIKKYLFIDISPHVSKTRIL
ncbi:hypothetical protein [Methanoregula sp.]|jgi:hypothetical protein|uniref:hypothetical protein n=1 Tax=Methanoregula sp. TaxID=2052170 RepID=UPI0025E91EA7|nr:hypothetical protein [Methanoregula sp.]